MAISYPINLTNNIHWEIADLRLMRQNEFSTDGRGYTQAKMIGSPLWKANYTSIGLDFLEAEALDALYENLQGAINTFYVHAYRRPFPGGLTSAAGLDFSAVEVASIASNNKEVTLSGVPAGFTLLAGDYVSIVNTNGGIEFHKIAVGSTANGSGVTGLIEFTSHVRPSVVVGQPVILVNPYLEMFIPAQHDYNQVSGSVYTIGFEAIQFVR